MNRNWWKSTVRLVWPSGIAGSGISLTFMIIGIWLGMIVFDLYHLVAFILFGMIIGFVYILLIRLTNLILEPFLGGYKRKFLIQLFRDFLLISLIFYFLTLLLHRLLFKTIAIPRDLFYVTLAVGVITVVVTVFIRYFELEKDNMKLERENVELSFERERNRLARDVHDTLGHTMTLVLTLLEAGQLSCEKDLDIAKKYLTEAAQLTREGISELRNSIRGLVPETLNAYSLPDAIQKLASDFQTTGMTVDFSYSGLEDDLDPDHSVAVYRICQEALTNSSRHGKAKEVSIILQIKNGWIRLFIIDNGCGSKLVQPGFGLIGMKQRVEELQGKISFGSDGKRGFTIHAEIPC